MKRMASRILLVEDELSHAELIRRAFEAEDLDEVLTVAHNLAEARRIIAEASPILIITDLRLPDGSGIELLPAKSDVVQYPVVIMTGHGDENAAVKAMKAGALDYVVKSERTMSNMCSIADNALRSWMQTSEQRKEQENRIHDLAELKTRVRDLEAYAHTVAHNLKTPLGGIVGIANLLAEDFLAFSREERYRFMRAIVRSGKKMGNIIDELLMMATVNDTEVNLEALDMQEIVDEAISRLEYLIEDHTPRIGLPDEWPRALGYAPWVEEVWVNYLSNAIKYGGRPPRIEMGSDLTAEGTVRFWIRDNGRGLSDIERSRLFVPLAKLNSALTRGHGLGLSIVNRIVEKLGGKVGSEATGIDGQGTTFYFTLKPAQE